MKGLRARLTQEKVAGLSQREEIMKQKKSLIRNQFGAAKKSWAPRKEEVMAFVNEKAP